MQILAGKERTTEQKPASCCSAALPEITEVFQSGYQH